MQMSKLLEFANSDHASDLEYIAAEWFSPSDTMSLDDSIIAYGPIYQAFSLAGKFSLNGSDRGQRTVYLNSRNL